VESIFIIREVIAEFRAPVLLYSSRKDSCDRVGNSAGAGDRARAERQGWLIVFDSANSMDKEET
jgi:hypothetical protein